MSLDIKMECPVLGIDQCERTNSVPRLTIKASTANTRHYLTRNMISQFKVSKMSLHTILEKISRALVFGNLKCAKM